MRGNLAINKWVSVATTLHLTYYSYHLLLGKTINTPANTAPQNTILLYSNNSHLLLVYLSRGTI